MTRPCTDLKASLLSLFLTLFLVPLEPGLLARPQEPKESDTYADQSDKELSYQYKQIWKLVKDNTVFVEKLDHFETWKHKYDRKLNCKTDLELAVEKMLASVDSEFTYLRGPTETNNRLSQDFSQGQVSAGKLDQSTAYLSISSFCSQYTALEVRQALVKVGPFKSLVIDLRDNPGGYVEQAFQTFALLAAEGEFVRIEGREDGKIYREILYLDSEIAYQSVNGRLLKGQRNPALAANAEILVLVNEETRSAAEMLAGALHDVRKAKLLGKKTFGKGLVQNTWYFANGYSLKIAMAKYFLPSGTYLHKSGLSPDVPVEFNEIPPLSGRKVDQRGFLAQINKRLHPLKKSKIGKSGKEAGAGNGQKPGH